MPFFDTNILVYSQDIRDARKTGVARALVERHVADMVVSTQVLLEFYNTVVRKGYCTAPTAFEFCEFWSEGKVVATTPALLLEAMALQQSRQISIFDALIVQAALHAGCRILYTEDLEHGLRIGDLEIVDPFREQAAVHEPVPADVPRKSTRRSR